MRFLRDRTALLDLGGAGVAELVTIVSALVTFPLLLKSLGDDGYGRYAGALGIAGLLSMALAAWVPQWLLESVLRHHRTRQYSVAVALGLSAGGLALGSLAGFVLAQIFLPHVSVWIVLAVTVGELVTASVSALSVTVVHLSRSFAYAARFRFWPTLCKPVVCVVLYATGSLTLVNYAVVLCAAQLAMAVTLLLVAKSIGGEAHGLRRPQLQHVREGAPYAGTMFTWVIQEDFDKTLLNTYGFVTDAGRYSAAYKVLQMASLPARTAVTATHHRFLQQSERPALDHTRRAGRLSLFVGMYSAAVAIGIFVLADWVPKLLGKAFESAVTPLRAICFVLIFRSLTWFPFNALMGLGRHRARMIILFVVATTNLGLNVVLIPSMSWKGAALSTYVSEILFLGSAWFVLWRALRAETHAFENGTLVTPPDPARVQAEADT